MLTINSRIAIPLGELNFTFARSGGPGGQNVNKVNTKAQLKWHITQTACLPADVLARFQARFANRITKDGALVIQSQRYRDRNRNVADCLAKLQQMVAEAAIAPKRRRATRPTRSSQTARLRQKQAHGQKKQQRRTPPASD